MPLEYEVPGLQLVSDVLQEVCSTRRQDMLAVDVPAVMNHLADDAAGAGIEVDGDVIEDGVTHQRHQAPSGGPEPADGRDTEDQAGQENDPDGGGARDSGEDRL